MNINVLVIEDERADRVVVRETLLNTAAGSSHVEYRESLAAGLARIALGGIDIVLLDLSLPDSEGSATLHALRNAAPHIPVLVIAGDAAEPADRGVRRFILREQADCHRLAHVLRAVTRQRPSLDSATPSDAAHLCSLVSMQHLSSEGVRVSEARS